jgi:hypothetical protein
MTPEKKSNNVQPQISLGNGTWKTTFSRSEKTTSMNARKRSLTMSSHKLSGGMHMSHILRCPVQSFKDLYKDMHHRMTHVPVVSERGDPEYLCRTSLPNFEIKLQP